MNRFLPPAALTCLLLLVALRASDAVPRSAPGEASASSTAAGSSPDGAIDGNRFSIEPRCSWRGSPNEKTWWWQIRFREPRAVAAILQINGDGPSVLSSAPKRYVWQSSPDGQRWHDLKETETPCERRLFRLHRLTDPCRAAYLRIVVHESLGPSPTLREVEFYDQDAAGQKAATRGISDLRSVPTPCGTSLRPSRGPSPPRRPGRQARRSGDRVGSVRSPRGSSFPHRERPPSGRGCRP